jgi:hypothetical protein
VKEIEPQKFTTARRLNSVKDRKDETAISYGLIEHSFV